MGNLIKMINDSKEWVFSGIGVAILTAIVGFFINKQSNSVKNKIGNNSNNNNQAGRDINSGGKNNGD